MARNDNATLKPSRGYFYTAAVGTECPTDLASVGIDWTEVGHTSIDSILSVSSEGGESTILGTLQNPALRQTISDRTESWAFVLQQWDEESLKLYFGSNMVDINEDGSLLGVNTAPAPTESAFLVVLLDGSRTFGLWAPRASLYRGDDMSIDDTESLAGLPINVTPLGHLTNDFTYALTPMSA